MSAGAKLEARQQQARFNGLVKLNLSTTATFGTEETSYCREFNSKSQCMDFLSAGTKKGGRCREMAVSGSSTVLLLFVIAGWHMGVFRRDIDSEKKLSTFPAI